MQSAQLDLDKEFSIIAGNGRSQAAEMVIAPNEHEGGPDNRHRQSDQWLFVVSGIGEAIVEGKRHPLSHGTLVLIERGETHEIRNTGQEALRTVNFYVPPAY